LISKFTPFYHKGQCLLIKLTAVTADENANDIRVLRTRTGEAGVRGTFSPSLELLLTFLNDRLRCRIDLSRGRGEAGEQSMHPRRYQFYREGGGVWSLVFDSAPGRWHIEKRIHGKRAVRLTLAEFEASDRGRQLREPFAGALREAEADA
jgi:hypothetical protein